MKVKIEDLKKMIANLEIGDIMSECVDIQVIEKTNTILITHPTQYRDAASNYHEIKAVK